MARCARARSTTRRATLPESWASSGAGADSPASSTSSRSLPGPTRRRWPISSGRARAGKPSGLQSPPVPGEERRFLDVSEPEDLHGQPLEADREPAVRGHAVLEDREVARVVLGIEAPLAHLADKQGVVVDALAPGGDLEAPEEEVEAPGHLGVLL